MSFMSGVASHIFTNDSYQNIILKGNTLFECAKELENKIYCAGEEWEDRQYDELKCALEGIHDYDLELMRLAEMCVKQLYEFSNLL